MSEIKVNKISPRSGTTVTLGDSGDTFTIPSGATINNQGTATNFGATGAASWTTTVKTGDFTAVAGEGYFVNTTSGEIDVALPAGSAGAVVAVKDYANTWDTNNCILVPNGSDKIGGLAASAILSTEGQAVTLVFIDSTQGWLVTDDGLQSAADNNPFLVATGGTITTSGNDKIHTFTGPGTFTVSQIADSSANNQVSYMVVAGGGGGGGCGSDGIGGGGGAGGFREDKSPVTPYTSSPLEGAGAITVTATGFPITVGGGGAKCTSGSSSVFSTTTSAGGGRGGLRSTGTAGGSGGGGAHEGNAGGSGNTPPVSPPQGNSGGSGINSSPIYPAGGGGGAAEAGNTDAQGEGGDGVTTSINATPTAYAGGGGGGVNDSSTVKPGGTGGGGAGSNNPTNAQSGTANTGGGGGGSSNSSPSPSVGGSGGSGIVIIRYKFQ